MDDEWHDHFYGRVRQFHILFDYHAPLDGIICSRAHVKNITYQIHCTLLDWEFRPTNPPNIQPENWDL